MSVATLAVNEMRQDRQFKEANLSFKNLKGELQHDFNLARFTSWRVGGNAQRFYRPYDLADLQNFLKQLPVDENITWLGLGSNVLIRDGGIDGTVILTLNRLNEITLLENNQLRAEAGVTCAKLAKHCVKAGFENGAFFAGIPGTVGGALAMNAGAFGGETWRQVVAVEMLTKTGEFVHRPPSDFDIQYRQVDGLHDAYFVAGIFQFEPGNSEKAKTDLNALLKKRNSSQPIGTYSCGSVFRNPKNDFAARLIESSGLKGFKIGNAFVSDKHANFILNAGDAKAADIEALIAHVQNTVQEQHGVLLQREVHILGNR